MTKTTGKSITIAFLGNANLDSRIVSLHRSLTSDGWIVNIISFDWFSGDHIPRDKFPVYKLNKKSPLRFYPKFLFLLFKELIKSKTDIYLAEEIYSLPLCHLVARFRGKKLYYNSRELFAFLGGLRNKSKIQAFFAFLERFYINKNDFVLTTGEMDSEFLKHHYGTENTIVIRNIPSYRKPRNIIDLKKELGVSADSIILLYQGMILEGRGISLIYDLMLLSEKLVFVLVGDGPFRQKFEMEAQELKIDDRVFFLGMKSQEELYEYTAGADFGCALIENISVSYYHALPNKLFEYIMAEIPVISCDLPQMKRIIEEYETGIAVNLENKQQAISEIMQFIERNGRNDYYRKKAAEASKVLNWETEYLKVKKVLFS